MVVSAYQQLILVSLIQTGEPPKLPKYTPHSVNTAFSGSKILEALIPYEEFSSAFQKHDTKSLEEGIEKNSSTFQSDNNIGLVHLARDALLKHKFKALGIAYLTLSFKEIQEKLELKSSVEELVMKLTAEDSNFAVIVDSRNSMVQFKPENSRRNLGDELTVQLNRVHQLLSDLHAMDRSITISSKFGRSFKAEDYFSLDDDLVPPASETMDVTPL